MTPEVEHLVSRRFALYWNNKKALELDFSPLIEANLDLINQFAKSGVYCLLHWQARPKGLRQSGIYDSKTNQYYSHEEENLQVKQVKNLVWVKIDENKANSVPTSAILLPDLSVRKKGNKLELIT